MALYQLGRFCEVATFQLGSGCMVLFVARLQFGPPASIRRVEIDHASCVRFLQLASAPVFEDSQFSGKVPPLLGQLASVIAILCFHRGQAILLFRFQRSRVFVPQREQSLLLLAPQAG
jgi:hypothetical protein